MGPWALEPMGPGAEDFSQKGVSLNKKDSTCPTNDSITKKNFFKSVQKVDKIKTVFFIKSDTFFPANVKNEGSFNMGRGNVKCLTKS